ncbi:unnamed protein product, partial [Closterium sp. NIES-54]
VVITVLLVSSRHSSTCSRQSSRRLTSLSITSTNYSRGLTRRCTRCSSYSCTPATTTRHATSATSAASARTLTAPPATRTLRPRIIRNSSYGHVCSGSGEGGSAP